MNGDNGHRRVRVLGRDYYWLCAVETTTGTPIVDGPHDTESETYNVGLSKLTPQGIEFEVRAWPTVDKNRATAMWKHERFTRGDRITEIIQRRTKHKI